MPIYLGVSKNGIYSKSTESSFSPSFDNHELYERPCRLPLAASSSAQMLHAACSKKTSQDVWHPKQLDFFAFPKTKILDFPILGKYIHSMTFNAWPTFCPQMTDQKSLEEFPLLLGLPVLREVYQISSHRPGVNMNPGL